MGCGATRPPPHDSSASATSNPSKWNGSGGANNEASRERFQHLGDDQPSTWAQRRPKSGFQDARRGHEEADSPGGSSNGGGNSHRLRAIGLSHEKRYEAGAFVEDLDIIEGDLDTPHDLQPITDQDLLKKYAVSDAGKKRIGKGQMFASHGEPLIRMQPRSEEANGILQDYVHLPSNKVGGLTLQHHPSQVSP
eukprot:CAMPEP_0206430566 /NCGR_PEP_ID=MMETSP0324_2-20121206/6886_1 /ASSEMBLY_ACC=CAM_ASM_000836 /TAXON_ID=2866 /ORGANISM="Crypthecodinium cohnii, Strain Seligo" /LENGTH=192 /DNA_ID=CAMNT_0053896409 /DNA_START=229 /DNA_END=807 /DNA_ORIENTATION=+